MKGIKFILAVSGILIIPIAYVIALFSGGECCENGYVHEEIKFTNAESWILFGFLFIAAFFIFNLFAKNISYNEKKKAIDP